MNRYLSVSLLALVLATSAGCSQHVKELEARLDSAENNAATARLRADEALPQGGAGDGRWPTRPSAPPTKPTRERSTC
jgi:hypothetical protein